MKKWKISIFTAVFMFGFLFTTNPTEDDYDRFSEKIYGKQPDSNLPTELERLNFLFFSTYTPVVAFENGVTHLGIAGKFIKISEGQFDYPWFLEIFN
ncbi:hypothetical protein [Neobacillus sp. D3-1R]|uniref:hypothetical protein n=1 Tax=Neobacillus sp. D3-1R TaxID=3445778 RepID=UPI003F9ECBAC